MESFNLVVGIHSIKEAIKNRNYYKLVGTDEALSEIRKDVKVDSTKVQICSPHKVQEEAKAYYKQLEIEYHRVPSNVFLLVSELEVGSVKDLYDAVSAGEAKRVLALDQISDVHNAGAIVRTACFYNVDYIIVPSRKSFGLTPSFFRIASGAAEYVKLVEANKLSKTITKLKELGSTCIALSEHAEEDINSLLQTESLVLVLGKEDTGISNAVLRVCDHKISLTPQGQTQSLNVSIASAIAMEKCFGNS